MSSWENAHSLAEISVEVGVVGVVFDVCRGCGLDELPVLEVRGEELAGCGVAGELAGGLACGVLLLELGVVGDGASEGVDGKVWRLGVSSCW